PDFLDKIVRKAEATGAGMAQPLVLRMADHNVIDISGHQLHWGLIVARGANELNKGQYKDSSGLIAVSGACALYKAEMIRQIGMLDEYYTHGHEDTEYGWRATKAGWKIAYDPSAVIYHKGQVSGKKMQKIKPGFVNAIYKDAPRACKKYGTGIQKIQFVILMGYHGTRSVIGKYLGRHDVGFEPYSVAIREMLFGTDQVS
ncbi:MAG: glycosyltransferase, partial [Methanoregula sp.]